MEETKTVTIRLGLQDLKCIIQLFLINYTTTDLTTYLEKGFSAFSLLSDNLNLPTIEEIIRLHYETNRTDLEILSIKKTGAIIEVDCNRLDVEQQETRVVFKKTLIEAKKLIKKGRTYKGVTNALDYLSGNCGISTIEELLKHESFLCLRPNDNLKHFNKPAYKELMKIFESMGVKYFQLPDYYRRGGLDEM